MAGSGPPAHALLLLLPLNRRWRRVTLYLSLDTAAPQGLSLEDASGCSTLHCHFCVLDLEHRKAGEEMLTLKTNL